MTLPDAKLPLVSIVAVNYNNGKYVLETLNSIAAQTYPNIELIVVDDCSTDDSVQKIEKWLADYQKPFKFIKCPRNQGVCATFNKGYRAAAGKYISSTATDDLILPEKIQNQVFLFETLSEDVGMIYGDAYLINDDSEKLYGTLIQRFRKFDHVPSGDIFDALVEGNFIPPMAVMIKSAVLKTVGYYDEQLPYEDFDMWLRIAKRYKIVFQKEITAVYRKRKNSLTNSFKSGDWLYYDLKILDKHLDKETAKKRAAALAAALYFEGYPSEKISGNYRYIEKGFTRKCLQWGIPYNITKSILAFFKRL